MPLLASLIAGILFGLGLTVAGMTNPQKVLNFLDIAAMRSGRWDPTLLMVFVGALPVMFVAYRRQAGTSKPWLAGAFQIPTSNVIDARLAGGSALFGIGWGLAGLCPGPAVAALVLAPRLGIGAAVVVFTAMLIGVWAANVTGLNGRTSQEAAV